MIVADYFAMLADDLAGRPYVKAQHNAVVRAQTGRSRPSVEFKYRNISAVLDKLGMRWIPGYKPASHAQTEAIPEAIERYLVRNPDALNPPIPTVHVPTNTDVFVPAPAPCPAEPIGDAVRRLIRKFDPVERDRRNRALGQAGEEFVLELERRQLTELGRQDLSRRVRWIAEEDGDGAGYDVLSFDATGRERLLEVKTTNGSAQTPFFLTRNEAALASERPDHWRLYRVHLFAKSPRIFTIAPPLEIALRLEPQIWRASL